MTGLIVLGCILLFFVFILSLRAKITIEYNDEVRLSVRVLCFKIKILPSKKKKKGPVSMSRKKAEKIKAGLKKKARKKREKAQAKKKKKQEKKEFAAAHPEQKKKKMSLSEILDIVAMAKDVLATVIKTFFGHLRVDLARMHIKLALGDAATTAIAYGAVSEAAMYLFYMLEPLDGFDAPGVEDASIEADFTGEKTTVDIKISLSLRVWHLFHVVFAAIGKAIKHLFKIKLKKSK